MMEEWTGESLLGQNKFFWARITGYDGVKFYAWIEVTPLAGSFQIMDGGREGTLISTPAFAPNNLSIPVGSYVAIKRGYFDPARDWVYVILPSGSGQQGVGIPGMDGEEGEMGLAIPGPIGATGAVGATGASIPGLDGDEGEMGLGVPGPTGPSGAVGAAGASIPGLDGDEGEMGWGFPGNPGDTGQTGPIGSVGMPGQDGEEGEMGLAIPGPIGPTGDVGAAGASIPGLDGNEGEMGLVVPGPIGNTGETGPAGASIPGLDGDEGEMGLGVPGLIGPQGEGGSTGSVGMPGQDGEEGEMGLVVPGPVGQVGSVGPTGYGIPGLDGEEGEMGMPIPSPPSTVSSSGGDFESAYIPGASPTHYYLAGADTPIAVSTLSSSGIRNKLFAFPFIGRGGTIDSIGVYVSAGSADTLNKCQVGIYSNSGLADPYPDELLVTSGDLSVENSAVFSSGAVSLVTVRGALYWGVVIFNNSGNNCAVKTVANTVSNSNGPLGFDSTFIPCLGWSIAQTYPLPSTFPGSMNTATLLQVGPTAVMHYSA